MLAGTLFYAQAELLKESLNSMAAAPTGKFDARFADLLQSPNLHAYAALNTAEEINSLCRPCANKGLSNPHISYDPLQGAARVVTDQAGIHSKWQLRKYFPAINRKNAEKVSFQWEAKFDEGYLSTGRLQTYKAFQLTSTNENLMFEFQAQFSKVDPKTIALPTLRIYFPTKYSELDDNTPVSFPGPYISPKTKKPIDNWQPGGQTAAARTMLPLPLKAHMNPDYFSPFLIRVNQWVRYTAEFTFTNGEFRVKVWLSDESTPPTLVHASKNDSSKGLLLSDNPDKSMTFQNWWLEMNSSQDGPLPGPATVWVKNFVVYKNASIPL
tara:strand:- start:157585 stop:158559 length:975 start_codon:yes stop_codon:yes gene_type:complete